MLAIDSEQMALHSFIFRLVTRARIEEILWFNNQGGTMFLKSKSHG